MSHLLIFANSCGAVIVKFKLITRQQVEYLAKLGTIIAMAGCIIAVLDKDAEKNN
jgi:hypothetical protein